jgi:DNA polymerase-3 subunit gamma/tau
MTYIPLYRKWRSQNFDEIVGQEHIVQTLKNAIKSGRISHAYLFSGPRGTGKTSTARIFAKSLNCAGGPTVNPCGKCDQCTKIRNGHAADVFEIDAASNRGIDEIRDLREKVRYTPIECRYKVYIIDEVHMLTTEAFNALLKTLEEPPLHAIFILATTEAQKVPVTISSRCQRLDFRRISNNEIVEQIKKIAAAEIIKIDEEAASLIARNSEGSMRDAISLFDQLISFSGKTVKHDDVIAVLGTANADLIFELGEALGKNDIGKLLDLVHKLVSEGRSVPQVTKEILMHLRNLLLVILNSESSIEESTEHIDKLKVQARLFDISKLKEMIGVISKVEVDMKWHPQARLLLEVAVMEACSTELSDKLNAKPIQSSSVGLSEIKNKWELILSEVKKKNAFAYISLHEGQPYSLENDRLIIKFKKGFAFHKARLEENTSKSIVENALKHVLNKDIKIESVIESAPERTTSSPEVSATRVAELFGGQIVS